MAFDWPFHRFRWELHLLSSKFVHWVKSHHHQRMAQSAHKSKPKSQLLPSAALAARIEALQILKGISRIFSAKWKPAGANSKKSAQDKQTSEIQHNMNIERIRANTKQPSCERMFTSSWAWNLRGWLRGCQDAGWGKSSIPVLESHSVHIFCFQQAFLWV